MLVTPELLHLRAVAAVQLAAFQRRLLTYEELFAACRSSYLLSNSECAEIDQALSKIFDQDFAQNSPYRSALVISAETGLPKLEFFSHATDKGISLVDKKEQILFWMRQVIDLGVSSFPLSTLETLQKILESNL